MKQLLSNQAQKEQTINDNFNAVAASSLFGIRQEPGFSGLNFFYYGGFMYDLDGNLVHLEHLSFALDANKKNYIYFDKSDMSLKKVTTTTSTADNFNLIPIGMIPVALIRTNSSEIISFTDLRVVNYMTK